MKIIHHNDFFWLVEGIHIPGKALISEREGEKPRVLTWDGAAFQINESYVEAGLAFVLDQFDNVIGNVSKIDFWNAEKPSVDIRLFKKDGFDQGYQTANAFCKDNAAAYFQIGAEPTKWTEGDDAVVITNWTFRTLTMKLKEEDYE